MIRPVRTHAVATTIVSVLAGVMTMAAVLLSSACASASTHRKVLFGARAQPRGSDPRVTKSLEENAVLHLESQIGRKLRIDHFYGHFDEKWPDERFWWDRRGGRIPFLTWDPEGPMFTWRQIARGRADSILKARARAARRYGGRIYLSFHHEPENDTGRYGRPADFVRAWRHVVRKFRRAGARNVKFVLILEAQTFEHGGARRWYPGRSYVNYVGADGYNWHGARRGAAWRTVGEIFRPFYHWSVRHHVRAMITETGCIEDHSSPLRKARWFYKGRRWVHRHRNIKAFIYFNSSQQYPWWVDSSPASLAAFRAMGHDRLFR